MRTLILVIFFSFLDLAFSYRKLIANKWGAQCRDVRILATKGGSSFPYRRSASNDASKSTPLSAKPEAPSKPKLAKVQSTLNKNIATNHANANEMGSILKTSASGSRLNKCLNGLSRRAADDAIIEGRVTINGCVAPSGSRVNKGDVVRLDGQMQHWEAAAMAKESAPSRVLEDRNFVYLKYWKPAGVTCTSDPTDSTSIIKAGQFDLFPQRLFTVGRLDKDSTGLILLTSDGRVNNAMLNPHAKKEKVYIVDTNKAATDAQLKQLAEGIIITTTSQRDGKSKAANTVTAKTKPCRIKRIPASNPASRRIEFTLTEGRNRQIRKMVEAIGLQVVSLHRVGFCGIGLKGLAEGNWVELGESDMAVVQKAIQASNEAGSGGVGRAVEFKDDEE